MIGVGTRWSDFTTASQSAFQDPDVRFVNVNVAALDAAKQAGLRAGGRRARWRSTRCAPRSTATAPTPLERRAAAEEARAWDAEVERL